MPQLTRWLALSCSLATLNCREAPSPAAMAPPGGQLRGSATLGVILSRDASEAGPLQAEGITWDSIIVVISDVELHACEQAASPWRLISEAHAHVPGSPTRLGTPMALELLATPGRAKIIGEAAPPLVELCALTVVLAPADDDVINATDLDEEALVGKTLLARGRDADGQPVALTSQARLTWRVEVERGALALTKRQTQLFALIEVSVSEQMVTGLRGESGELEVDRLVESVVNKMQFFSKNAGDTKR
jgi:hypothetical protein